MSVLPKKYTRNDNSQRESEDPSWRAWLKNRDINQNRPPRLHLLISCKNISHRYLLFNSTLFLLLTHFILFTLFCLQLSQDPRASLIIRVQSLTLATIMYHLSCPLNYYGRKIQGINVEMLARRNFWINDLIFIRQLKFCLDDSLAKMVDRIFVSI